VFSKFGGLFLIGGLYLVVLWGALAYWSLKDARARSENPSFHLYALAINLVFPLTGLLVYMLSRPSITLAEYRSLELEAEALSHNAEAEDTRQCPACGRDIERDFVLCPYCQTRFAKRCPECHKAVRLGWRLCPYCAATIDVATVARAAGQSRR
jgi:RNA polymerase subunit RPABC4/transcription elongation factor Spt4